MPLIVATRNPGKRREFAVLLGDLVPDDEVFDVGSWHEPIPDVVEDRDSFEGNAFKKAWETSIATHCTTLADDSGLEVDALDGAPGVYSARWADGEGDQANNAKLVRELEGVPDEARTARYVAVLCLVIGNDDVGRRLLGHLDPENAEPMEYPNAPFEEGVLATYGDRHAVWFRATCEGRIVDEPKGDGGFGYDPHFYVDDWGQTMAEVSLAKKNERSHRAAAVRKLVEFLGGAA